MHITQDNITQYFQDENALFFTWGADDSFALEDVFNLDEYVSLVITLSGTIDFSTNIQPRVGDDKHILIFTNDLSVSVSRISPDYTSMGILFSKKFWSETLVHAHPYTTLILIHPCLQTTPEQKTMLVNFLDFIRLAKEMHLKDTEPLVKHLIIGMFCEIGKIYEDWSDGFPKRSTQNLLSEFALLLYSNYKQHRDVDFYADSLSISKRHFSAMIKSATGMSAFKCIELYVILKASSMLKNTNMSIKEIALNLNFDDTSHFCKYFRKNMKMSPEQYRKTKF